MQGRSNHAAVLVLALLAADPREDGCHVDGADQLQAVLDTCTALGTVPATVIVRPNTTIIVEEPVRLYSNLRLRCGPGSSIRLADSVAAPGKPVITNADQSKGNGNIHIEGCTIDGNKARQTAGDAFTTGVSLMNVYQVRMTRLEIRATVGIGIYGNRWRDVEIDHNRFVDWRTGNIGAIELHAQSGVSTRVNVHHNRCDGTVSRSSCFKFQASNRSTLTYLDVSHNAVTVGQDPEHETLGIELFNTSKEDDTSIRHIVIESNIVNVDPTANGTVFCISLGGGGVRYATVNGNVVEGCTAFGIESIGSYVTVSNNSLSNSGPITWDANETSHRDLLIMGNVIAHPAGRGIFLIQSAGHTLERALIIGNTIEEPGQAAFRIQNSDAESRIFDVKLVDNVIHGTPNEFAAIETFGAVVRTQIERNQMTLIRGDGLRLGRGGREFLIADNMFVGPGTFLRASGVSYVRNDRNLVNGRRSH